MSQKKNMSQNTGMDNDTQSRKWLITINNPIDKGFTHEKIKEELIKFKSLIYWCMSDEIGQEGTFHTHFYIQAPGGIRFGKLKKHFNGGHFDVANGTAAENRDYVFKEGKWLNDKKGETNIRDSHEDMGTEVPVERQGARNDLADLYDMIKQDMSTYEIIDNAPDFLFRVNDIERVRQVIRQEKYKNTLRFLDVTYIYGKTGTGKTRGVMEKYDYDVYRITDYHHPFDNYSGQEAIIFEEFRSDLKIQDMLNYLDIYPLDLPCRYNNKKACYTKVFIITNIMLEEQYPNVQKEFPETWNAFLRRIKKVEVFKSEKEIDRYDSVEQYFNRDSGFVQLVDYQQVEILFE
jgi:hypothetical protein